MKPRIILAALACALPLATATRAEQSGSGHYISGGFNDFSTTAPDTPGWTFANLGLWYDNARAGGERGLPFGGSVAASIKSQIYAEIPGVLYSPPFQILGAQPSAGLLLPYNMVQVRALGDITTRLGDISPGRTDWASGFGDMVLVPFWLCWTDGDFKYGLQPVIFAPTGEYDKNKLANVGLGYWTFTPVVS